MGENKSRTRKNKLLPYVAVVGSIGLAAVVGYQLYKTLREIDELDYEDIVRGHPFDGNDKKR